MKSRKQSDLRILVTAVALACVSTGSAQEPDTTTLATPRVDASAEQPVERARLADATPPAAPMPANRLLATTGWTPMLVLTGMLALIAAIWRGMRRRSRDLDVS